MSREVSDQKMRSHMQGIAVCVDLADCLKLQLFLASRFMGGGGAERTVILFISYLARAK